MQELKTLPMHYYERNLIFSKNGAHAVYEYDMMPYPYQSKDQKRAILDVLHDFLWLYRGKGKLVLLNRQMTVEEVVAGVEEMQQENPFPETYSKWINDMKTELEARRPWYQQLFMVLDLPKKTSQKVDVFQAYSEGGMKKVGRELIDAGISTFSSAALRAIGLEKDMDERELIQTFNEEANLYTSIRQAGNIEKATPQDIELLCKAPFYRQMGRIPLTERKKTPVAKISKDSKVYLKPSKAYMTTLFSHGRIVPDWENIEVHHPDGRISYQTHMVLTGLPEDGIHNMDQEWLLWLSEMFDFPVDIVLNFEVKDPAKEASVVRSKQHDMKGEISSNEENNLEEDKNYDSLDKGRILTRKLGTGQPIVMMEVVIAVSAETKEQLRERVERIRAFYEPRMFSLSVVQSMQMTLFEKFFPWSTSSDHWRFPVDPGMISASGIHCTATLGTQKGFWLGSINDEKPILADLGWAMRNNRAGTIMLLSSMGGGKSATKKALKLVVLLMGGYVFSSDPKGEDHVFLRNPEVAKETKHIQFGIGANNTKINIFKLSQDKDRATQYAKSYVGLILNGKDAQERSLLISKLVQDTMKDDNPNMLLFEELLREYLKNLEDDQLRKQANIMIMMLETYRIDPLAKIIFHNDPDELYLDQYRLVICDTKGLKLPTKGADLTKIDDTTKLSLGVMLLIGYMGRECLQHRANDVLKMYDSDEDWIYENIQEMQELKKELVKMSRSQYVAPLFATQEANDVKTPDVRNNLGWVFVGKMESSNEIRDAMSMMGIDEVTEEMIREVRSLESGEFYLRDPLGRKDLIKVWMPKDWLAWFETTPKPKKETNEKQVS
ncbi:ATP-binding protein [Brevibacillus laterosporus]|uniref:ATP-binding protein n=1 Tax=Brevibacillus laterosporus TaxID=1465 RepID=A0AAP3G9I0_BRELA|nr:ATP-binding protein [Brevibacillus laterosporus]MCR8982442.1 ATP-binding protein [Brevibacillus laterosporus]MCZ0809598.1 ATP-binding protein [Brevibacillus laterosporus]MCZ0828131.1 ATP-binding protein [Brevibacillus laterosporus]MCZ0852153.1 ATP-binding protein [Brevibacillus laterosporus]